MLTQMRGFARSWLAYLLLFVLVIAFAIWGVNDVFSGVSAQHVAKVGSYNITPAQLGRELELTLRSQRAQGANVTQQEAIDAGMHTRLLEGMIGRYALYDFADKLGVSASDRQVADRIRSIPNVLNQVSGQFDETAYAQFLQELRYSRDEFERDVRGDMTNQMLIEALLSGVRPPSSFGALALAYESETRVISIAEAPAGAVGQIAPPTDEQLQVFYEENAEALAVPEYRSLTLALARPTDFAARVDVPESRLDEELEARRASLAGPERRTYVRVTAQNETQANDIVRRISAGESAAAVAQSLSLQLTRGEEQTREEVPDARVAEAVFSMGAGAAPRVVRGQLAPFVVVRVESITVPQAPDLAALRAQIRNQIAMEEASALLNDAIGAFEDARAGGASVADAARQHGLPVVTITAVDAQGRDQAGQAVAELVGLEDVLRTAFETPEGEASDFIPAGEADAMVSVDRVIPESVRPLEQVAGELRAAWVGRERARRLRELGDQVSAAVAGGQSFAAAARASRMNVVITSQPIDRRSVQQIPARALGPQIFQARQGEVVSDLRVDGQALLVAVVEQINRVDPAEQPQLVEASRAQTVEALTQSFASALQDEVRSRANPRLNQRVIDRTFPSSSATDEQQ